MFKLDERMLSDWDVPHALYRGAPFFKSFRAIGAQKVNSMQIQQIMSQPVIFCQSTANLSEAARLMWEHDCGIVPVVDEEGRVISVLTDRDICMAAWTQGKPLCEIGVQGVMSAGLVVCRPEDSIEQAEEKMSAHQIRRIPVVTLTGHPVGMISLNDLARSAAEANNKPHGGTNGVRMTAAARTLAAVSMLRLHSTGPKVA